MVRLSEVALLAHVKAKRPFDSCAEDLNDVASTRARCTAADVRLYSVDSRQMSRVDTAGYEQINLRHYDDWSPT